jgi:CubicO group peptidase (beta-lactamase class C family)
MKKFLFLLSALGVMYNCSAQNVTAKLDELVGAYAKEGRFNGAVLVATQGKIVLDKGYGLRDVSSNSINDEHSIFKIGSLTKQFTATLILKLQEMKKLSVNDKLSKYFPAYPKGDSITIDQLLHHTSGIYNYSGNREFMRNEISTSHDRKAMMALFQDKPLDFSPGTQWKYSNSAYLLLGYIIEDVSGMSYYAAARKYLFTPAEMNKSGFDFTRLSDTKKTTGYLRLNEQMNNAAPVVDSSVPFSAGAIYSTTGDLYRWNQALWNHKLINKASTELALTPIKNKYGFGLFIDSLYGKRKVEHSGSIPGFNSNMVTIPADQTCVILLGNASTNFLDTMAKSLLAILYNKPYNIPEPFKRMAIAEADLKEFEGTYADGAMPPFKVWLEKGKLIGQPEGQEALELRPEKKDLFFIKEEEARVRFNRDDKNQLISLSIIQGGREMTIPRKP